MYVGHCTHVGHGMHVGHGACMCSCWRGSGCCCATSIPAVGIAFRLASRCFLRCFRWRRMSAAENTPHETWLASHICDFTHGVLSIRQHGSAWAFSLGAVVAGGAFCSACLGGGRWLVVVGVEGVEVLLFFFSKFYHSCCTPPTATHLPLTLHVQRQGLLPLPIQCSPSSHLGTRRK